MAELKIISMDKVEIKPVNWLWYPYIPFGKVTIMQGDPGEGKTTIALRIAALLSKGEKLPCDDTEQVPTVVIYQTAEDGLDDTVKPRLIEADAHAYEMAVKEAGGEEYILSAVMHADERNKSLGEELGKDVFHYHLHVVYVPVVEKKILWSKRCKDKALIGTVKEIITQVSHSKKWSSEKYKDDLGKTHLISSYSKLQDRFFEHISSAGYQNIERGEKGSSDENLHHTEFKAIKEKERLEMLQNKVELEQKSLDEKQVQVKQLGDKIAQEKGSLQEIKAKKTALKNAVLDSSKVVVDKTEFEDVKALAKKQIVYESKEKKLAEDNKKLAVQVQTLQKENQIQKTELDSYKSVRNQLNVAGVEAELSNVKKMLNKVLEFVEKLGLRAQLERFLNQKIDKAR